MSLKITGKLPTGRRKARILGSPNYKNGAFQNLSPTPMKPEGISYWKMMREFFKKHPGTAPPVALPFVQTDLQHLPEGPLVIWFGHSSYLVRIEGKNFLIDPVFSGNAAPVSFMVKAFAGANQYRVRDMPEIDYLILTHDHYDHLDYKTLIGLKKKVKHIYCSLGIGAHLSHWGFADDRFTEMDWWQTEKLADRIELTATPARHFSGRGLKRAQSLWSSFVLKTAGHSIYLGGDSGYDTHFKTIGDKIGPFDLAILESGQYNTMWPLIHMMPEETVQAAVDLQAKALLPVHWGKFRLGMHPWNEPIQRLIAKANQLNMPVLTPSIGQVLMIGGENELRRWWEGV